MAPRRKSIGSLRVPLTDNLNKENNYLRSLSDFQARVRRRESIRNYKNVAVSKYSIIYRILLFTIRCVL